MRINQNIAAFNAYRNLNVTSGQQAKSLEKLSSGFRINRAADDAAGLVNSENLRAQIGGLKVATRNAQDAISLVQTAEGAQTEVHSILQRMRDLTVQSANSGTNDEASLNANQSEIDQLKQELNRIASQTQYGTKQILGGEITAIDSAATPAVAAEAGDLVENNGEWLKVVVDPADGSTAGKGQIFEADANALGNGTALRKAGDDTLEFTFQVGANAGQTVTAKVGSVFADDLGVAALDVTTDAGAKTALTALDNAISSVSANRADLGAFQNRMESTIRNVSVATENLQAAESRIRDTDMAAEMVSFTRSQIMQQAGTAMLAQANQVPQSVLSLLR